MIHRGVLQHRLADLARELPSVQVQNRLMACTDRDVALALVGMTEEDAESVLRHLSPRKAGRIREERALEERRRVDEKHVIFSLNLLIASLEGERALPGRRSYVRPRRDQQRGNV
jgi:hypothetical protein